MTPQEWTPYFSGHSSTLEVLWQTALIQSPWLKVTPQGITIDWNTARTMNPDSFPETNAPDCTSVVKLLIDFIPWDWLQPDKPRLKDPIKSAHVALGRLPVDQNQEILWQTFIRNTTHFMAELQHKLEAYAKYPRHKKISDGFNLDVYELLLEELLDFPHLEFELGLKMDLTYLNPWKYPHQNPHSYRTRDRDGLGNFRTATHRNRTLIDLTNRVSTWLIDRAKHSPGRIPPSPEDFAAILPQLSECARLHWKARVPMRAIETEVATLVYGEPWRTSNLYNKIYAMITKFKNLVQVYELETQDTSLGAMVKSLESDFHKTSEEISYRRHDFLAQNGYGSSHELSLNFNSHLTCLVTETPLLALLYSGLFQLYENNIKIPKIFGFSPLVMSLQCAAKLTGSTLFTEPTSDETTGTESSIESTLESSPENSMEASLETSDRNLKSTKTKYIPLDHFSGAQLWVKVNRV